MIRHTVFVRMPNDGFALETSIYPSHFRLLSCQSSLFNLGLGAMWRLLAMTQYHQIFGEGERSINTSYKSRLNRKLENVENNTFLRLTNLCEDSNNVGRQYIKPSNVTVAGGVVGSITENLYHLLLLF